MECGDKEYAEQSAVELGITECFMGFCPNPRCYSATSLPTPSAAFVLSSNRLGTLEGRHDGRTRKDRAQAVQTIHPLLTARL